MASTETCDWEARIALEIIEKTWEEIMMVGEPNTSGVNKKEFVKNSFAREEDTKLQVPSSNRTTDNKEATSAIERGLKEKSAEMKTRKNENIIVNDANNKEIVSDAYRIPNEDIVVVRQSTSTVVNDREAETATPVILESYETGKEDNKGKLETNNNDVGSCSLGANDESSDEYISPSEIDTSTATILSSLPSSSTIEGSKGDPQYCSDNNNSKRIAEVMDNTRCIFPAASEIATATIIGDNTKSHELQQLQHQRKRMYPFITINPSYLNSVSGDELLVAFDEIMAIACTDPSSDDPCSFILPEETTSASWLDLIRFYATTDATAPDGTRSIPLYMLVLCRFQFSLAKSYSERSLTQNDEKDQVSVEQPNSHKLTSVWLSALMTTIRELENDESTEIEKVLSKLASNLPEDKKSSNESLDHKKFELEKYLLLPFTVLAQRSEEKSEDSPEDVEDPQDIDSVIVDSSSGGNLSGKEDPSLSKPDNPQDGDRISRSDTIPPLENESQDNTNNVSNSMPSVGRRGKKKKKKKKKRGGTSAGISTKPQITEKPVEAETKEKNETEDKSVETETIQQVETNKTDRDEEDYILKDVENNGETHAAVDSIVAESPSIKSSVSGESDKSTIATTNSEEENTIAEKPESEGGSGIHLLKTNRSGGVVPSQAKPSNEIAANVSKKEDPKDAQNTNGDDQEDQWETVEVRPRGRKKTTDKGNGMRLGSQGNMGSSNGTNTKKKAPRTKETRARIKTRKMVKEILGGVLDDVEENVRRRRNASRERAHLQRNQVIISSTNNIAALPSKKSSLAVTNQKSNSSKKIGSSLRDILVRGKLSNQNQQVKNANKVKSSPLSYSERAKSLMKSDSNEEKKSIPRRKSEKPSHITGSKTNKALRAARASPVDQNTLPTIASTNSAFTPSVTNVAVRKPGATQSTDSSESESAESKKLKNTPSDTSKYVSPSPPLPTMLSPGNNNSTSSSVASSLDAPHAGHHGNKSHQSENDVGCHLLSVCDRLSSEIDVFMKRREVALEVRRHERGLVLAALEKTLSLIWPGKPTVEMYGSCATNLDLPSSDLDVVVCGLDRPYAEPVSSPTNSSSVASNSPGNTSPVQDDTNQEDASPKAESHQDIPLYISDQRYSQHQITPYQMQMMYGHMSLNAERVLRLAMELEHQPWAVHVKAIPTASVPVIKILADPARLQGAVMNGNADWLVQQPMHGQSRAENVESRHGNQAHISHYSGQQSSPLWRGADVVNGLLKVDITFEGPEHGGIGSTIFSKQVVEDFAKETDLSPECTPQVQVLMVLKELLAQRRSNEPFSGGLSSYALLLLVISMIGERKIICEELEKTERQRRVVAAGGGNSALQLTQSGSMEPAQNEGQKYSLEKIQNRKVDLFKPQEAEPNYSQVLSQRQESTAKITGESKEHSENTVWKEKPAKPDHSKPAKKSGAAVAPASLQRTSVPSSWATIARSKASSSNLSTSEKKQDDPDKNPESNSALPNGQDQNVPKKPSSFADAVAKGKSLPVTPVTSNHKKVYTAKKNEGKKRFDGLLDPPSYKLAKPKIEKEEKTITKPQQAKESGDDSEQAKVRKSVSSSDAKQSKGLPVTSRNTNLNGSPDSSGFPLGFHDVIEVLCSGETTPGKLLMHFLLFYGQHFESQSTAIDYSGTHQRDPADNNSYSIRSSYMLRRNTGSYDLVTGMYSVDPIVVYDPLEGAENNNVARSCFAWSSIRWVFAQSYMTLSSAAEQNAGDGTRSRATTGASGEGPAYGHDESGNVVVDPSSPLLELLLSF
uniref:Poly(A) RNA polymerase mitochondrial-like central palm domain-containing protein n=1 Tax=Pseudo-nitzschia australis TaxID=44445 RepID=A0A7S4AFL3_9STRA